MKQRQHHQQQYSTFYLVLQPSLKSYHFTPTEETSILSTRKLQLHRTNGKATVTAREEWQDYQYNAVGVG
jgi:hypothetical protein